MGADAGSKQRIYFSILVAGPVVMTPASLGALPAALCDTVELRPRPKVTLSSFNLLRSEVSAVHSHLGEGRSGPVSVTVCISNVSENNETTKPSSLDPPRPAGPRLQVHVQPRTLDRDTLLGPGHGSLCRSVGTSLEQEAHQAAGFPDNEVLVSLHRAGRTPKSLRGSPVPSPGSHSSRRRASPRCTSVPVSRGQPLPVRFPRSHVGAFSICAHLVLPLPATEPLRGRR